MEKEITAKNEIVTILNHLRLKRIGVNLNDINRKIVLSGFVTKSDSNFISVYLDKIPELMPLKNLQISFEYNRFFYASDKTEIRIINIPLKNIELTIPQKLTYHTVRKYTRVRLPKDQVKLAISKLESQTDTATPKVNVDELPPNLQKIYLELMDESPDIKRIINMIGEELSRFSNRFKINIFKDVKNFTPLEKVVYTYKKTFWISNTDNLNNYVHLGAKYNIIGYEKYFEMAGKTLSPDILEQIRSNYVNRGINSYCIVPILIGERVAGVIEVSVPHEATFKNLSIYDIFYIKGLADILAEVLVKSKTSTFSEEELFNVIDISLGGVLANTKNIYLPRSLKENSVVKLILSLDEQEIQVRARIVRYDYIPGENAGLNIAFEFLEVGNEIKNIIGNFIRKFLKSAYENSTE